jgi:hypothetical protein
VQKLLQNSLFSAATVTPTTSSKKINKVCQHLTPLQLPVKNAVIILGYNEYWSIRRFSRKSLVKFDLWQDGLPEVSTLCLQKSAIDTSNPFNGLADAKPRKVVFRT